MTYLNHDHRERENVRFLAISPILKSLWRSQALGSDILSGILDRRTQNSRATLGIHEQI